jgi:asparagine synthase (glutamine-hydrolysing)
MAAPLQRFGAGPERKATGALGSIAVVPQHDEGDVFGDGIDVAGIWGCARFSDGDLADLARREGPARALAQGYADRGADVLSRLSGSFAVAIASRRRGEVLLAVDRLGTRPMFYTSAKGTLVFGTTLDSIAAFPGQQRHIDPQAIYHYLYFHMVPGPRTIHRDLKRLLPGTFLTWRNGVTTTHSYWQMHFVEDERRPFSELKSEFIGLLRDSVARSAEKGRVGAFLSGGTDSSTIAGMLGDMTGEPAQTYSIGFAADGYDEMHYARIAARHFRTNHHEHYITPQDVVEAIPLIAAAHDQPFGNSSAVPTYYCAKFAKDDGVQTMLGGDGGDELFGGNERYAKQYLYSLYSDRPWFLRKAFIEPIAFRLPKAVPLVGKVQRYIRNASQPMPARYDNYNLVEHLGATTIFTPELLEAVDQTAPAAEMTEMYWSHRSAFLINRMLQFDLKYTLADNDLPKVLGSCELAGVTARFPMLDERLVAFSARLPPELKLKGTRLRYFFKEALRGFLPDEIITKTKHGFGLPFGPWLRAHEPLRQIAFDSLSDLKRRRIVSAAFIDELTSSKVWIHPQYYGTMVWILMMLEQWFRRCSRASLVVSGADRLAGEAA